ncbi:hypothetical protein Btru_062366 [Bulinus truncatus]|nr:hypothetical protein Btru_062366 [Bulinus truncatus]
MCATELQFSVLWFKDKCNVTESCSAKYNRSQFVAGLKVIDYVGLSQNEYQLAANLTCIGPLVAGFNAAGLQFYRSGIYTSHTCNTNSLDHAFLLTGYNITKNDTKYWIVKNSWGTLWGEGGYAKIAFGVGACGINKYCDWCIGLTQQILYDWCIGLTQQILYDWCIGLTQQIL